MTSFLLKMVTAYIGRLYWVYLCLVVGICISYFHDVLLFFMMNR